jgi:hypothetical protein
MENVKSFPRNDFWLYLLSGNNWAVFSPISLSYAEPRSSAEAKKKKINVEKVSQNGASLRVHRTLHAGWKATLPID